METTMLLLASIYLGCLVVGLVFVAGASIVSEER